MKQVLIASAAAILFAGCQTVPIDGPRASANLTPTEGNGARGVVFFYQVGPQRTQVVAELSGLKPGQAHGFRVSEAGDCSAGDAGSGKGLPQLKADAAGRASLDAFVDNVITVQPAPDSALGRALVVQGDAGARVSCAVIQPRAAG